MYSSLLTSIFIQVITWVIEIGAMFIKVPTQYFFLKQMMLLELVVQFIEGSFYIYWLYHFKTIRNITPQRYFDWMITTPTMLVNLIFYLLFLESTQPLDFLTVFQKEWKMILLVLLLNWMMLLFGYLGETSTFPGVFLGFIPFIVYYYLIYTNYALLSGTGLLIFYYFLFFWSLYGVVAMFPYTLKNMCYNVLDLFSKNFFGLFLTYLLLTKSVGFYS
jgi:hypothetical protein